jgi:hypothetical protein
MFDVEKYQTRFHQAGSAGTDSFLAYPTARVLGVNERIRLAFGGSGPHGQPCPIGTNVE